MASDTNLATWHSIRRSKIPWNPSVVEDRCVGCGLCLISYGRGVYAFDYEQNRPVVCVPQMCMVGCTTCATLCTQDAIEFPSQGVIRQIIRKNRLLRYAKDLIRENRERYEVKVSKG